MKVLKQDWVTPKGSERTSLSKNLDALDQEKSDIVTEEESLTPQDEPEEITIPDDSIFAEMVNSRGTIFLNEDEYKIVLDSPEYQ